MNQRMCLGCILYYGEGDEAVAFVSRMFDLTSGTVVSGFSREFPVFEDNDPSKRIGVWSVRCARCILKQILMVCVTLAFDHPMPVEMLQELCRQKSSDIPMIPCVFGIEQQEYPLQILTEETPLQ